MWVREAAVERMRRDCSKLLQKRGERVAEARGYGDAAQIALEGVIKLLLEEERRFGLRSSEQTTPPGVKRSTLNFGKRFGTIRNCPD